MESGMADRLRPRTRVLVLVLVLVPVVLVVLVSGGEVTDLEFERSPGPVVSSLGKPVTLHCALRGRGGEREDPPDVLWLRDGLVLQFADTNQFQVHTGSNTWTVMSTLSIEKVQLQDMGTYRCAVHTETHQTMSQEGSVQLEGLPHFSVEPQHRSVVANESLDLVCVAHGPPDPVRVIWLQDGAPLNALEDAVALSPSTLHLAGLNRTSTFSCEAHNGKGVATSGSGTVTVLPAEPQDVKALEATPTSILLSWQPAFGGVYPIIRCSVQAKLAGGSPGPDQLIHNVNINVPPANHMLRELQPHRSYAVRVACHSSQGPSDWTPWAELRTKEGVPENCPVNVSAVLNGTEVLLTWAEPQGNLNGDLQGYRVEYSTPDQQVVQLDSGLDTELSINVSVPPSNVSFRVCAYTGAGPGPWTRIQTLTLITPEMEEFRGPESPPPSRGTGGSSSWRSPPPSRWPP